MKDRNIDRLLLIVLAAALAVFTAAHATADDGSRTTAAQALERSSLSAKEREDLAVRARTAVRAGIPEEDVEIIVGRGLERGVDAGTLGSFLETAARTKQQGLPARPVLDRIEQGLSKGVPPERIDAAAGRLADGLAKAKPLVEGLLQNGLRVGAGGAKDAALESVARAGEQGLSAGTMQGLGEKVRSRGQSLEQFERAVRTLSFLSGSGMQADAAERVVSACIDRDLTERDYARLERKVSDMVRQGRSLDDIVRAADREANKERGSGEGRDSGRHDRGTGGNRDAGGRGGRGK
jgi:hypothetical protein